MTQAKSISRRIFQLISAISLLLCIAVCAFWIAATFYPRWRVTFRWDDQGTTITSSNTAIGWSAQGIYQARLRDEFSFPDLQSAKGVKQVFAQAAPAGTSRIAIVPNANTAIVIYKPGQPVTGFATRHSFQQSLTSFPNYAGRFAVLPIVYLLFIFWDRQRTHRLCENCRHDLQGNESGVCPACGTAIGFRKLVA